MEKNLTEQEKLDMLKLVFSKAGEDILYFYIDLADIKVQKGMAKDFSEAVYQLRDEYLDFQKKNPKKKQPVGNFEQQAEGLKEIFSVKNEKLEKINKDIDNIFSDMDKDAKNDKNRNRKSLDIKNIVISQIDNDRK